MKGKIELLAPAGGIQALKAAILAGADAVYLAGRKFGARAFAENFDESGLQWARRVTNSLGVKMYVTLNTLVLDEEFPQLDEVLDFYEALQPDALILQDFGVIDRLQERRSRIPRHLSTQSAWDGNGGAQFLTDLGITRVILPRETSLERMRILARSSGLEIEVFVHGAMCFSISGRCFWSHALGERSGNRGTCAQPCRKAYRRESSGRGHFFSPKDLRLAEYIDRLKRTGVCSLKIEGRMKSPEYVFQVTRVYRHLLDGKPTDIEQLDAVFSRPFQPGFIDGSPEGTWSTPDGPGKQEIPVGKVLGKPDREGLMPVACDRRLHAGDGLLWQVRGERAGARLTFIEPVGDSPGTFRVRGLPELPSGTELWLTDVQPQENWAAAWNRDWERQPIELFWSGRESQPLAVETIHRGRAVRLTTEEPLKRARIAGLEAGPLAEKFALLGETFRVVRHVTKALDSGMFVSPPSLKKLKRELVETLLGLEKIHVLAAPTIFLQDMGRKPVDSSLDLTETGGNDGNGESRLIIRLWQDSPYLGECLKPDVWLVRLSDAGIPVWLRGRPTGFWIPPLTEGKERKRTEELLADLPGQEFLCMGWEAFDWIRKFPRHRFRLDWSFNLVNDRALAVAQRTGLSGTFSLEHPDPASSRFRDTAWQVVPWNPLISMTRFPLGENLNQIFANSHGDRFFARELLPGVGGIFLLSPHDLVFQKVPTGRVQIDLAIAPGENPMGITRRLSEMIDRFRVAFPVDGKENPA
jgi:collagenase-like PrtC family protease